MIAGVVDNKINLSQVPATSVSNVASDSDTRDSFIAGDNNTSEQLSPVTTKQGGGELPWIREN